MAAHSSSLGGWGRRTASLSPAWESWQLSDTLLQNKNEKGLRILLNTKALDSISSIRKKNVDRFKVAFTFMLLS